MYSFFYLNAFCIEFKAAYDRSRINMNSLDDLFDAYPVPENGPEAVQRDRK